MKADEVLSKIETARRWRDEKGYDKLWSTLLDTYRGKHYSSTDPGDKVAVNVAFANVNVLVPAVAVNNPKVTVSGSSPEDGDQAVIAEAVVNYLWRHHSYQRQILRAVKDSIIFGHGVCKVYWKFSEAERDLTPEEVDAEFERRRREVEAYANENPTMASSLPTDDEIRLAASQAKGSRIVEDRPCVERVSPFDMFFDPAAASFDDARWIAQRVIRTVGEVRRDERYNSSVRRKVEGDMMSPNADKVDARRERAKGDRVSIWEFYDIENGTFSVVCSEGFLIPPREMPYAFGHPFVFVSNYEVPEMLYPIGDIEPILPLQQELNKIRTLQMNARKHYGRKYLFYEQAFGPEGRAALTSNADNVVVPVIDNTRPLSDVVQPFPYIPINAEIYNLSNQVENDINLVSGITEYARGSLPETRRTATEASILSDAYNSRAADKLARVEKFMAEVARKVIQLMQQYMTGEQMARVVGPGGEAWFAFTVDDIAGEFDFNVEAGSSQPLNETARRQQTISMLNAMAPLVGSVIDPVALATHALKYGFGIENPEKFLISQAPAAAGAEAGGGGGMPPVEEPPLNNAGAEIPPEVMAVLTQGASQENLNNTAGGQVV